MIRLYSCALCFEQQQLSSDELVGNFLANRGKLGFGRFTVIEALAHSALKSQVVLVDRDFPVTDPGVQYVATGGLESGCRAVSGERTGGKSDQ